MLRFFILLIVLVTGHTAIAAERLLVFAAASQRDVLELLGKEFEKTCGCDLVFSFASTAVLARQINAGADVQLFVSANEAWVDWLQARGRVREQDRHVIAGNQLVIASSAKTKDSFNILMRDRFAMADPNSVPAGIYAVQALRKMDLWEQVKSNAVYAENVRLALYSVRRGDLLSGIVYRSDLVNVPSLHAHYVFPEHTHEPIHYVATVLTSFPLAREFVEFLISDAAQETFASFGFSPISATK